MDKKDDWFYISVSGIIVSIVLICSIYAVSNSGKVRHVGILQAMHELDSLTRINDSLIIKKAYLQGQSDCLGWVKNKIEEK
jgi:hypothetical protein